MNIEFTGEMFLPWTEIDNTHYEHVHRYFIAQKFVKEKKVLDIACGEGYGCKILSKNCKSVTGVDINKEIVAHAKKKYQSENIEFIEGSMTRIPISGKKIFDVITCFEAIEHTKEQNKLLSEVTRLLTDNGIFLVSTPNKNQYHYKENEFNPFHEKELTLNEFHELIQSFFPFVKLYGQKTIVTSNIWPLSDEVEKFTEFPIKRFNDKYTESNIREKNFDFVIALASLSDLKDITIDPSFIANTSDAKTYISRIEKELINKNNDISTLKSWILKMQKELDPQNRLALVENFEKFSILEKNRRKYYSSRL